MADYHVYLVGADGNVCDVVSLVCADDEEAISLAAELSLGQDVELWQVDRKVATFADQNRAT